MVLSKLQTYREAILDIQNYTQPLIPQAWDSQNLRHTKTRHRSWCISIFNVRMTCYTVFTVKTLLTAPRQTLNNNQRLVDQNLKQADDPLASRWLGQYLHRRILTKIPFSLLGKFPFSPEKKRVWGRYFMQQRNIWQLRSRPALRGAGSKMNIYSTVFDVISKDLSISIDVTFIDGIILQLSRRSHCRIAIKADFSISVQVWYFSNRRFIYRYSSFVYRYR